MPDPSTRLGNVTYSADMVEAMLGEVEDYARRLRVGNDKPQALPVRELMRRNSESAEPDSLVTPTRDPTSGSGTETWTASERAAFASHPGWSKEDKDATLEERQAMVQDRQPPRDLVNNHLENLLGFVLEARNHLGAALSRDHAIVALQREGSDTRHRGNPESELDSCYACDKAVIRLKSGYCEACYMAWYRTDQGQGRMDRVQFQRMRRREEQAS